MVVSDRVQAATLLAKLGKLLAGKWLAGLSRLLLKDSEEEAFFRFILSMLRHNLLLKMQFYPTVGIVAAIFVPPLLTKSHIIDPFVQADFGRAAMLSITSFLFGIGGLAVLLPYSNEYEAGWLFQIAPVARPKAVLSALKKAVAAVLLMPIFLLNLLFFSLFWPFADALKISVFGLLLGFVMLQVVLLTFRGFPFSRKIEKVTISRFLLIFFFMMALPFVLIYLPSPFAGNPVRFLTILVVLLIASVLLGRGNSYLYVRSGMRSSEGAPPDVQLVQHSSQPT
jgi:hypothetical protein